MYNATSKLGQRECFKTAQEAYAWVDRQIELWTCQGAIPPVYRVDYGGTYVDRNGKPV